MRSIILLDTHVVIWLYENRANLGSHAVQLLENKDQPLAISYISLMEMAIKNATGKLHYEDKVFDDFVEQDIQLLMPDRALLSNYRIFNPDNKDRFDNLLIATALDNRYALMTTDHKILAAKIPRLRTIDASK